MLICYKLGINNYSCFTLPAPEGPEIIRGGKPIILGDRVEKVLSEFNLNLVAIMIMK